MKDSNGRFQVGEWEVHFKNIEAIASIGNISQVSHIWIWVRRIVVPDRGGPEDSEDCHH